MRVTIIPSEYKIQIDGRLVLIDEEDWDFDDHHIHAIQWRDNRGHIEFVTNDPNQEILDIEIIQDYISRFFDEIPKIEQIRIQNEEKRRLEEQNFAEEEDLHKKELEDLRRRIQETSEENARLRKKREEDSIARTNEIIEKENEERRLKIEKELLAIENERLKSVEEINLREKMFEKHFREQNEEFLTAQEKLAKETSQIEEKLQSHLEAVEENQKAILESVENQRKVLQIQEKEFEENRKLKEEQFEVVKETISLEYEKLQKEKDLNEQSFELELKSIENRRKDLITQYTEAEQQINVSLSENEIALIELENKKREIEEYSAAKNEELSALIEQAKILKEENEIRSRELDLKKIQVEKILEERSENKHIEEYNTIKEKSISDFISKKTEESYQKVAAEKASNMMREISENVDPLAFMSLIGSDARFDIKNFPVEKMLAWFTLLKKVKDLSNQYNLSYDEVLNNEQVRSIIALEQENI